MILAATLMILVFLAFASSIILTNVTNSRREQKRLFHLLYSRPD